MGTEQEFFDGSVFCGIAEWGAGGMRVYIVDCLWLYACMAQCIAHGESWPLAILTRRRHVMSVAGQTIACNLSIYFSSPLLCMLKFLVSSAVWACSQEMTAANLEYHYASTFSNHKSISSPIEWTA